jgi:hypothetical protein
MSKEKDSYNQRVTQKEKDADDQSYYKEQLDLLDSKAFSRVNSFHGEEVSEYKRKKVNYELFNNKLNLADFSYVCQPFGSEIGELPAQMANRDIISGKIKALLGMEAKRPFTWKVLAVNEDATTRKEQETFGRVRDFVIAQIMQPIQEQIELKYQEQLQGKKLSADQQKQIQQQIAEEVQSATPPEVMKYMAREYQDPAEVLSRQIMKYLMQKETITDKFLKAFKHGCIAGEEVYWVGLINNEPILKVINPLYFDYAKAPDQELIEDSEWGVAEFRMTPSQLIGQFREELQDSDIDNIYENYPIGGPSRLIDTENFWSFDDEGYQNSIRVLYGEWKGERKIGFLSAIDESGELTEIMVDENYKLNTENGDVEIDWQWIPEVHHGYKVCLSEPLYIGMGPIPGQHKDLDNLNECKLRFIGVCYDNMNSETTSIVDRMKAYQYYYNIIMYRIELLMASDKGKIMLMNINAVPKSAGIDLKKFQFFLESNKLAFFNPAEEGHKGQGTSAGEVATMIDMSLVSDISKYIDIANYIEERCGSSVGITDSVEGQTAPNEAVRNAQSNLIQSSNILEPYFQLHNMAKRNVLQRLIETAKVGYATGKPKKLAYVLDDMSTELLSLDEVAQELLDNSTYGIFVGDSTNDADAKLQVSQLAHAAMQNQQIDLLDVVKVIRSTDIQEAEELLEVGTQKAQQQAQQQQQSQQQAQQQMEEAQRQHEQEQWQHEKDMVVLKADEDRKTKVQVATISAMGYDLNKDEDQDGEPDVLEVARDGVDANVKLRKIALEEKKQIDDNANKKKELEIKDKQVAVMARKVVTSK